MMPPQLGSVAQIFVARVLNSLPEGIFIAGFVWLILRLLPRQNSRTRFAVWFLVLIAVAALPFVGDCGVAHAALSLGGSSQPLVTLSSHWAFVFLIIWMAMACLAVLRLAIGVWRVRSLLKSCVAIDRAELDPETRRVVEEFSSSRPAPLVISEKLNVPAAIGFVRPKIVVPPWILRELPPQELDVILLHEFAHLQRRDSWTNLLQKIVRAVFCFHPAVWWIDKRLSLEREMACDDYVLAETDDPRGYAKVLVGMLERNVARRAWAMAQAAVSRAHEAALRLSQILDVNRATTKHVRKPALGVVSLFSLLCLVVLPQTRQLVGFAANDGATYREVASLPVSQGPALASAQVVPAAMHSTSAIKQAKSATQVVSRPKRHRSDAAVIMTKARSSKAPADLLRVSADEKVVSVTQAVLVIRTTSQAGGNSWQWSIRVWQVILTPDQTERIPVFAKKT